MESSPFPNSHFLRKYGMRNFAKQTRRKKQNAMLSEKEKKTSHGFMLDLKRRAESSLHLPFAKDVLTWPLGNKAKRLVILDKRLRFQSPSPIC